MAVLFNSSRPLGRCENTTAVFEAYDGPKDFIQCGFGDLSARGEDVIVTDEFLKVKRSNQVVIMIAHGLTGGKLYGRDQSEGLFVGHRGSCELVDYYITSSEYGRKFAASAANIPIERCIPLGMPRTDAYIGKKKGDARTFLTDYESAYLYAPTFRAYYDGPAPEIDWQKVDSLLEDDEVLAVKRHMITSKNLIGTDLKHIVEIDPSEPSTRYLIDCDVLATDFSSILFDGYVLGKPSVLTADENDKYITTRGMYMRYPFDYGSRYVAVEGNEEKFVRLLRSAKKTGMRRVEKECLRRVGDACDGESVKRVCELVKRFDNG